MAAINKENMFISKEWSEVMSLAERVVDNAINGYFEATEGSYGTLIVKKGVKAAVIWRIIKKDHALVSGRERELLKNTFFTMLLDILHGEEEKKEVNETMELELFNISITVKKLGDE